MKKRLIPWALLLCLAVCVSVAAAKDGEAREPAPPRSPEAAVTEIPRMIPADEFGGCFLEGEKLVVNVAGSESAAERRLEPLAEDIEIEFRSVKHPLRSLEQGKDFLAQYMGEFGISALDANEVTNRVDIYLSEYSESVFEEIEALVAGQFGEALPLHFIDTRGTEIKYTVAE